MVGGCAELRRPSRRRAWAPPHGCPGARDSRSARRQPSPGCEAAFLPRPSADPAVSRARAPAPWCRSPERTVTCPGRWRGRGSEVASGTRRVEPAAVHDHAVHRLSLLLLAGSPGRSAPSCRPAGRRPPSLSPAPGSRKRPRAPSLLVSRGGLVSGPGLYFFPAGGFAAVSPDAV